MEAPDFTQFIIDRINQNPEVAEINSAILSLYKKGLLHVYWDPDTEDFLMKTSPLGKDAFHESIASTFTPAEA